MIHLDQGGRYFYLKDWFDRAFEAGLSDFDVIGLSYYPFWHGTFNDLKETTEKLIQDFKKPIILAETAHAWRKSKNGFIDEAQEKIAGFAASPLGQRMVLDMDNTIMASLPDKMGRGIYYWEPLCIPRGDEGGWAENMGILDERGQAMEAIHSFEFVRDDAKPELPAKVYKPQRLTVQVHQNVRLPEEVKVLYRDGSIQSHKVKWENEGTVKADEIGTIFVKGQIDGLNGLSELDDEWTKPIVQEIEVVEKLMSQKNLFADANWDDGLTQWETDSSKDGVNVQLYPEFEDPFPAPPVNAVRVEGVKNFTFRISQKKKNLAPGRYVLKAQYAGTDTTGVEVNLFAEKTNDADTQNSELFQAVIHPTKEWQEAEIHFSIEEGYTLTAGLTISAPPVYGMVRRFLLYKEEIADGEKTLA